MKKSFCWLPRVLAVLFVGFISLFALDVLGGENWFLALLMHLVPSFILAILTAISWKQEAVGGFLFVVAGLAAIVCFGSVWLMVPSVVIGALFLISGFKGKC